MSNICVLFDFENINVSLQDNYELSLTIDGFKKFIEFTQSIGTIEMKNFLVGAFWDNFKPYKQYVTMTGTNRVDVPINTKNAADGSLIIELMKLKLSNELSKIDTVILFAGDGGYGSLIHYLYEEQKTVYICSVKNSTKEDLRTLANQHYWVEDIIGVVNKENYNANYCCKTSLLPEWKSVVIKANSFTKMPYMDKGFLAKQIFQSCGNHPPFNAYNTIEKCKKLVSVCCDNGILIEGDRIIAGGQSIKTVRVNTDHVLLKNV